MKVIRTDESIRSPSLLPLLSLSFLGHFAAFEQPEEFSEEVVTFTTLIIRADN